MDSRMARFRFWCQKVLPLVYDDSLSYYEVLCKVVDYLNKLSSNENDIRDILKIHEEDIAKLKEAMKNLEDDMQFLNDEFEKVKNGEYMSIYIDALAKWIDKNLQELVAKIVKYVFFALDDTGHFVAYIPQSWQFLHFDTGYDPTITETYGHLILTW